MLLARRAAWLLFLMALPALLLATRIHHWKKLRMRQACAAQIARLQAVQAREGLTKHDTLARELRALRCRAEGRHDRVARHCRRHLLLLPDQDRVVCLEHGLSSPPQGGSYEPSSWLDPATGEAASARRQLELAGVADEQILSLASDRPSPVPQASRRCGHGCVTDPTWLSLILAGCLAYAWALLRALKALWAAALGWPDPFGRRASRGQASLTPAGDGPLPPRIGC